MAEISERREESQVLQQSVKALSAKLRVPLRLFYFYGYSLQEISDYLGTPVPTLKKRLHDARRKLKGTLPVVPTSSPCSIICMREGKTCYILLTVML